MENWQIQDLPGACPTTYQLLFSSATFTFVLLCSGVLLVAGIIRTYQAGRAKTIQARNGHLWSVLTLLAFSGLILGLTWPPYQASQEILRYPATAPGTITTINLVVSKGDTSYTGRYQFRHDGHLFGGLVRLPPPQGTRRRAATIYKEYYTNNQHTVLFSSKDPQNSHIDLACPIANDSVPL